jgi:succinate dehydrogenase/fumarate reductase-like Fe-S protein
VARRARGGGGGGPLSRAASIAWLGWRFVAVQPLRKLLRRTPAKQRFAETWFPRGLLPTRAADREIALAAAACTGCGLCEPRCPLRATSPALGAMGLPSLFRLHAKHPGEVGAAAALVAACEGCEGCDDACPSGVPIARILAHYRRLASAAEAGGSGGTGA